MIAKKSGVCGAMLRRRYGVTCTSIASFTVRIKKIPFAITKCPFDLTTKYLSSDLKATGMLLIGPPPIRLAVLRPLRCRLPGT